MILSEKTLRNFSFNTNPEFLNLVGLFFDLGDGRKEELAIATRISFPFVSLYDAIEGRSTARTAASEVPKVSLIFIYCV